MLDDHPSWSTWFERRARSRHRRHPEYAFADRLQGGETTAYAKETLGIIDRDGLNGHVVVPAPTSEVASCLLPTCQRCNTIVKRGKTHCQHCEDGYSMCKSCGDRFLETRSLRRFDARYCPQCEAAATRLREDARHNL